jgi:hypothetical protein
MATVGGGCFDSWLVKKKKKRRRLLTVLFIRTGPVRVYPPFNVALHPFSLFNFI